MFFLQARVLEAGPEQETFFVDPLSEEEPNCLPMSFWDLCKSKLLSDISRLENPPILRISESEESKVDIYHPLISASRSFKFSEGDQGKSRHRLWNQTERRRMERGLGRLDGGTRDTW
ncbi:hypothetical protein HAX54_003326 [Datura stramonium]|uniref:Uncharacterized protein n=1 Tax=Datura stramonium TaxID=4076 RepID=A0ABS8T562_DATST|nr:hypothetical protein [Datura stramonium]